MIRLLPHDADAAAMRRQTESAAIVMKEYCASQALEDEELIDKMPSAAVGSARRQESRRGAVP